jgi:hypothetical protein
MMEITLNDFNNLRQKHLYSKGQNTPFEIKDYTIVGQFDLDTAALIVSATFTRCVFMGRTYIGMDSGFNKIVFDDCRFEDVVRFGVIKCDVSFPESVFKSQLIFTGAIVNLILSKFTVEGEFRIEGDYAGFLKLIEINKVG